VLSLNQPESLNPSQHTAPSVINGGEAYENAI
jgi:hypothetical protein